MLHIAVLAAVVALAVGSPARIAVASISNTSLLDDYQNCNYIFSVAGNTAGREVFYTPYAYSPGGVPCIVNYGDQWQNLFNIWTTNMTTLFSTGAGGYWLSGAQWPLPYPQNKTVMFATSYDLLTQLSGATVPALGNWGLNNMPYSNYDTDNFAIQASDNVLFYSYKYRQGQGYETLVSFVAMNLTTSTQITRGYFYQGDADNGGYPTGGVATLNSSFPGVPGAGNYSGGVAAVFLAADGSMWVTTYNASVNLTQTHPELMPQNITNTLGIYTLPGADNTTVLVLAVETGNASLAEADRIPLKDKLELGGTHLSRTLMVGPHVSSALAGAPTVTRLYRVNLATLKVEARIVVQDATAMCLGWKGLLAVLAVDSVKFLDAATFQQVGFTSLSNIDYYSPYVPVSAAFGTGFPGDASALLHFSSQGRAGPGLTSIRLKYV